MNRAEMILELWNNTNKKFKDTMDNIFFVENSRIYMENLESGHKSVITLGVVNYDMDYTEVIRPLWEVIENDDYYYIPCIDDETLYCSSVYRSDSAFHRHRVENRLVYRTKEEAIKRAKEILEMIK